MTPHPDQLKYFEMELKKILVGSLKRSAPKRGKSIPPISIAASAGKVSDYRNAEYALPDDV
jgi:hypothetical protein